MSDHKEPNEPSFIIFSGGSACNYITAAFQSVTPNVCYVLGISDNGGSTSELLRVLGGPSIGDLRSRLTRLIKTSDDEADELMAIKELLSYRLGAEGDEHTIRDEWAMIVEGRHRLWRRIPTEKKEAIRGFLVLFNCEVLKRAHKHFNFRNGSIAIFLFLSITDIREPTHVLPVINTNHTAAIAALLDDGHTLRGQCEISHPGQSKPLAGSMNPIDAFSRLALPSSPIALSSDDNEDLNSNLVFSKTVVEKLSAPIRRIYYMNEYGQEVYPLPNPKVIAHLRQRRDLVYSIGSLYTSILPCLILRGVGHAIATSPSLRVKILILNGTLDRETDGYTALDFIGAITNALNESQLIDARREFYDSLGDDHLSNPYHPDMLARPVDHGFRQWPPPPPPPVKPSLVDRIQIPRPNNLSALALDTTSISGRTTPPFPPERVPNYPPRTYITHLIYLSNSRIPVDLPRIEALGITCVSVDPDPEGMGEPLYGSDLLQSTLEQICGTRDE